MAPSVTTSYSSSAESRRPPLWLAALAMAAFWGAVYDLGRWTVLFALNPVHLDFRIFYVAAQAGLQRGWSNIYDVGVLRSLSTGFPAAERFVDSRSAFINPPVFAWVIAPLTALPLPVAYLVWTLVSLGALVLAWHLVAPYRGLAKFSLLLLALTVWPVMESLYWGQPSLEILALVAVAWWFLTQRDRPVAAGVALALAVAIKPNIVILLPLALLVGGRFRVFAAFAIASAVVGLAELRRGVVVGRNPVRAVRRGTFLLHDGETVRPGARDLWGGGSAGCARPLHRVSPAKRCRRRICRRLDRLSGFGVPSAPTGLRPARARGVAGAAHIAPGMASGLAAERDSDHAAHHARPADPAALVGCRVAGDTRRRSGQ